jgi:glyoxylase-like metal-dependent hydrolase (beta-lactamase superfamily II)
MRIADYDVFPVETGRLALDGGGMFGIVPKPLWSKLAPADDRNRITLAARGLVLRGHGRVILVDTGLGDKFSAKEIDIYALDNAGQLMAALGRLGLSFADVTDVLLTHLHFDHAGGAVNARREPVFPKATYYVQRRQWDHALHPTEKDMRSYRPDDFLPLHERGVLRLLDGNEPVFPHVELLIHDGHTDAEQAPKLSDGQQTLVHAGDLIPSVANVPLAWLTGYDLRPLVALEEKRALLTQAAEGNWILFSEHDPTVCAFRVRRSDKGIVLGETISL